MQQIIDIQKFKTRAVQWTNYEHEYSKDLERNDWNKSEIYVHKNCRSSFFQDNFMENKDVNIFSFYNSDVDKTVFNESTSSSSICSTIPRGTKRTSLAYTFSIDEKHCVIFNKAQHNSETWVPLALRTMDLKKHRDDLHETEKTLRLIRFIKKRGLNMLMWESASFCCWTQFQPSLLLMFLIMQNVTTPSGHPRRKLRQKTSQRTQNIYMSFSVWLKI